MNLFFCKSFADFNVIIAKKWNFGCLPNSLLQGKIFSMSQKIAVIGKKSLISMKNKKVVLWTALILMVINPVFAQNANDFKTDGKGTIIKYDGKDNKVVIPAKIGNEQVTAIGDSAFKNMGLTGVTISNSVTYIGSGAFSDNKLSSVIIGNNVNHIGDAAFQNNKLTGVIFGNSVNHIGDAAFQNNELISVIFGNSVNHIGDAAFQNNELTGVTIPNSVTHIGDRAFSENKLTKLTIGSSVTYIGAMAFSKNRLTGVTIPNSVINIGDNAFEDNQLTGISIGSGITGIWKDDFWTSDRLTGITADVNNPNYSSVDGILYNKAKTEFIFIPKKITGNITIPNGINSIKEKAFESKTITGVIIGNGVTDIGENAFSDCKSLTSVTIPNSITNIGKNAFSGCTGLTRVTLPANAGFSSIASNTFYNCSKLTNVTIPNSVTAIGESAFHGCTGLISVTIGNSVARIEENAFYGNKLLSVIIPNSVIYIGKHAFYSDSLISVRFERVDTAVDNNAFSSDSLSNVYRSGGVGTYTRASGSNNWTAPVVEVRDETESKAISRYYNLLNKATDLSQKVSEYRINRPKTTDIIIDSAKEYAALLTELAEFKKQNPPIVPTDMINLNNRINNIKDYFRWGAESWFNKNELDAFRKEFPSIFN